MPWTCDRRPSAMKFTKWPSAVEMAHILYGAFSGPMAPDEKKTQGCGGTVFLKSPWFSLNRKAFAVRVAGEVGPREALGDPDDPAEQPDSRNAARSIETTTNLRCTHERYLRQLFSFSARGDDRSSAAQSRALRTMIGRPEKATLWMNPLAGRPLADLGADHPGAA
jgi:hypothetical protein